MKHYLQLACFLVLTLLCQGCTLLSTFLKTQDTVSFKENYYAHPEELLGGHAVVYEPEQLRGNSDKDLLLLNRYAPTLIQGVQGAQSKRYASSSDEIGYPMISSDREDLSVLIDTERPTMFCRIEKEMVHGKELVQLVYSFWYPRHPVGGVQEGSIDGGVLRLTLDAGNRPTVFEYTQPCGCYHGVFIAEHAESWAKTEFIEKEHNKRQFTEKSVPGKTDWVVRDIVKNAHTYVRPVVWVSAGEHHCLAIQMRSDDLQIDHLPKRAYTLQNYSELTSLSDVKNSGKKKSMFNDEGLVWGAKRSGEELVLLGLDHPGWPRHLDNVKIHFDEANWLDSNLLEKYLRLPKNMIAEDAKTESYTRMSKKTKDSPLKNNKRISELLAKGKPLLILVTHAQCLACQAFKKNVLTDPKAQAALRKVTWLIVDTAKQRDKEIGDLAAVSFTPTLVLLNENGEEINRVEGIITLDQLIDVIEQK